MKGADLRRSQVFDDDNVALDFLGPKPEGVFPAVGASRARRLPAILGDEGFKVFNLRVPPPARVGRIPDQNAVYARRGHGDLRGNDDDPRAVFESEHVSSASRRNRDGLGLLDAVCLFGP
jgi:hypothetical protein